MNKDCRLLVFAHPLEASVFVKVLKFRLLKTSGGVSTLYRNPKGDFLLLTGEGIQLATQKLAWVLGAYAEGISEVHNFGVAGALTSRLKRGQCYTVRTVYAEASGSEMEFKSYTTPRRQGLSLQSVDCVTARDRVLGNHVTARVDRLSCFGDLIDRELWGIGSVCSMLRIPFFSLKLVVDHPGRELFDCAVIKKKGESWSQLLFEHFQEVLNKHSQTLLPSLQNDTSFELPKEFYVTHSQRLIIRKLFRSLKLQKGIQNNDIWKQVEGESLRGKSLAPKKRTALLIHKMEELVNPWKRLTHSFEKSLSKNQE